MERKELVHRDVRAHFVIQAHLDDLGLTARRLVRAHPDLDNYGAYCLGRSPECPPPTFCAVGYTAHSRVVRRQECAACPMFNRTWRGDAC